MYVFRCHRVSFMPARLCWQEQDHAGAEALMSRDQLVQALTEFGFIEAPDSQIDLITEQEFPGRQYQRGDWLLVIADTQDPVCFQLRSARTREIAKLDQGHGDTLTHLKLFVLDEDAKKVNRTTSGLLTEMFQSLQLASMEWSTLTPEEKLAQTESSAGLVNLVLELYLAKPDRPTQQTYSQLNAHVLAMLARDQKFVARPIDDAFIKDFTETFYTVRTRMLTGQIVTLVP